MQTDYGTYLKALAAFDKRRPLLREPAGFHDDWTLRLVMAKYPI